MIGENLFKVFKIIIKISISKPLNEIYTLHLRRLSSIYVPTQINSTKSFFKGLGLRKINFQASTRILKQTFQKL